MIEFGVSMFPADFAIQPAELAIAAEQRGFESLFFPEHTHIPASRKTPWPAGGDLPTEYWHTHDPFVALAAAAAVTKNLKLGTGVCLVVERDPITLAKEVASLDFISGGRVIFGIGAGWNVEEMENHGAQFKRRWRLVREKVLAMREIWTRDAAEFHGEFVNFDPIWSWPKPVQRGGPPILLGSQSKRAFERVADYCDGWMPINLRNYDFDRGARTLREAGKRAGREGLSISLFGAPAKDELIRHFMELGFERLIFGLPPAPRDTVLPLLDRYAQVAAKFK
ncbi:MAG TPA: LLM class F420-dependent oxidoreductase [Candidatus Binataceae bacterium]|nr:LLM class F420-dependent oxidoreductase [Candidatus Binataceae bacterium]